jgi:hypothetical protein
MRKEYLAYKGISRRRKESKGDGEEKEEVEGGRDVT